MNKKALFLVILFPIEIRTLAHIISLKHADFLALIGNEVLGIIWAEDKTAAVGIFASLMY